MKWEPSDIEREIEKVVKDPEASRMERLKALEVMIKLKSTLREKGKMMAKVVEHQPRTKTGERSLTDAS